MGSGGGTGNGGGNGGMQGSACKCQPDTPGMGAGAFECSGTDICAAGLWCIGYRTQGVDKGTCRLKCCSNKDECANNLTKQASCPSGMTCECISGTECFGNQCTCLGGVQASVAFCY